MNQIQIRRGLGAEIDKSKEEFRRGKKYFRNFLRIVDLRGRKLKSLSILVFLTLLSSQRNKRSKMILICLLMILMLKSNQTRRRDRLLMSKGTITFIAAKLLAKNIKSLTKLGKESSELLLRLKILKKINKLP